MPRLRRLTGLLALAPALALAAPAHAVPDCAGTAPARTVLSGQGVLESVIADDRGGLLYTDNSKAALMRLDRPGGTPRQVAPLPKPGGLLLEPGGTVIAGSGNGFQEGAIGNVSPMAKLLRIDPRTGRTATVATGLQMANGLARDLDGTIYGSDDAGRRGIDRFRNGKVEPGWAEVLSANGLAVNRAGRYLFANQTFVPAAIARVDLRDPAKVETFARPGPEDMSAGLDGMTIDQSDRLFVAANGGGQLWRVGSDRSICALARGLLLPSAVAFGGGGAFPATSLYAVTFSGNVVEVPRARPNPPVSSLPGTRVRLRVSPRRVRAGRRVRIRLRVWFQRGRTVTPAPRARVRLGRRVVRLNRRGRASIVRRFRRRGRVRVRVITRRRPGAAAVIRVLRR
jgi:sugar lactone lactonase YvrE